MRKGKHPSLVKRGVDHHNYMGGKLGPIKKGLTQKMRNFLTHYIECGNATEAVVKSYNFKDRKIATLYAWRLKQHPAIREILDMQRLKYKADVPEAYKVQKELMLSEKVRPDVRLRAAMDIQDRADLKATSKSISLTGKANIAELFEYDNPIERKTIIIEEEDTPIKEDRLQKTEEADSVGAPRKTMGDSEGHGEVHDDSSGEAVRKDNGGGIHSPEGDSESESENMGSSPDL